MSSGIFSSISIISLPEINTDFEKNGLSYKKAKRYLPLVANFHTVFANLHQWFLELSVAPLTVDLRDIKNP